MSTITKQDVLDQLEKLDPNAVNDPDCVYTNSGGDHCIAGQILVNLGRDLPPLDSEENDCGVTHPLMAKYVHGIERDAILFLEDLQRTADHDVASWETGGVAVGEGHVKFPWGEVITRVLEGRGF